MSDDNHPVHILDAVEEFRERVYPETPRPMVAFPWPGCEGRAAPGDASGEDVTVAPALDPPTWTRCIGP